MTINKALALSTMSRPMMQTAPATGPLATRGGVLVVMTNHDRYPGRDHHTGLWLTEMTHVYEALSEAGYTVDFVSPNGGDVPLDPRSLGWLYLDAAGKAYLRDPAFMARLQTTPAAAEVNPDGYLAIFYTGGHGTMWDFRGNRALKALAESIYRHGGIVASVCHGAAGLLDLETEDGIPLIAGLRVTGFSNLEETLSGVKADVPYLLQSELESRGARYEKSLLPFIPLVLTDSRIVTGQNPGSSKAVAQALLVALQNARQSQRTACLDQ